jgi:hypothetical protein
MWFFRQLWSRLASSHGVVFAIMVHILLLAGAIAVQILLTDEKLSR